MSDELKRILDGRIVVASISGGKDSAALSLWLTEQGIEHRRVFADTGWEHDSTYEYLRGTLAAKLGSIDEVGRPGGMVGLIAEKGAFPHRLGRFCTTELKTVPLSAYMMGIQNTEGEIVNAIGVRREESAARSDVEEWEWSSAFDCEVWRPLVAWTEADVIAIHSRHGLRPNPLYLAGARRVGCWPCINSRKSEVALVASMSPERIHSIRALEANVTAQAKARGVEEQYLPRSFFQGHGVNKGPPIDVVVEWSKTDHGGKQFKLIDDAPSGCVRWGLCDVAGMPK